MLSDDKNLIVNIKNTNNEEHKWLNDEEITITVGEMREIVDDALDKAFDKVNNDVNYEFPSNFEILSMFFFIILFILFIFVMLLIDF